MSQVSAVIADTTRERLERFAREHGVKKSHLIETALLHHLAALEELPADVLIPPVIVISRAVAKDVQHRISDPLPPTPALRALFDAD
jgi:hypothetical protein